MGGGGGMGGMGGGGMPTRTPKPTKAQEIVTRLKLNKDQTAEFQTILQTAAKDALPVVQQLQHNRDLLATATITGRNQAELDELSKAVAAAQFQMTGVEVQTFQKLFALLKPNQTAKAPEAFDLMAGIFDLTPSRGGGRGFGEGGGRRGGR
jgi:exonuclease VII large subunit